ncbi:response regulator transcription factor [Desulforamulus putei]|uniref:Stage 0 sporulation protein A homolog n=1 Tax=Desulforamulus putei DSM 12395 TaxID=1121429 RepID=A0A1M4VBF8_9FIRM|nr:response regulator transcription factor [Desulforamulus putei]SHE66282.1 two component transcriptional regulator, LuxR family [Desulforamulus putei DSM 12395]
MNAISLIIVDDHEIVREGLKLTLQREPDFNVVGEASSGRELIKLIKTTCPDVVLLDERMPEERGIEICRTLTKLYPDLKIIILTAYAEQEDYIVQAMMAGAKGFLIKNVEIFELKRAIRAVVRGETVLDSQVAASIVNKLKEVPNKNSSLSLLTEQQISIAKLVAQGLKNREIAEQLYLSENTIKFHIQNIMRKLNVNNRIALVAKLLEKDII